MAKINLPSNYIILELFHEHINQAVTEALITFPEKYSGKIHDQKKALELLLPNLLKRLLDLSEQILLAHYMVAEKQFEGAFVSEKLSEFCHSMKEPEVRSYFQGKYPLLFEGVELEIRQWLKQSRQIIERLYADLINIQEELFGGKDQGRITSIEFGLGDRHKGGESVSLIRFESGEKLIYKPGSRSLNQHFSTLCHWIDKKLETGFKTAKTIVRGTHSWVEFIPYQNCAAETEVHCYYERTGVYLAILYVLEASDFHYENIIACGAYPVLIDLESFFQPPMPMEGMEDNQGLDNSVLQVGLLPRILQADRDSTLDVSGLSDAAGFPGMMESLQFEFDESGHLRSSRKKGVLTGGKNIPMLNRQKIGLSMTYGKDIQRGFRKAYLFLRNNRKEIMERLDIFRNDEIRILFRNTLVYGHLLKEGKHPDILKTGKTMEAHLQWLDFALKEFPLVKYFSAAEKEDLRHHDIPYFYTRVNERHLWHNGQILWKDFFEKTGLETVSEKLRALSDDDLERQCWIIDSSLAISENLTKTTKTDQTGKPKSGERLKKRASEKDVYSKEDFLEVSVQLAEAAIKNMKISEKHAQWLVFKPIDLDSKNYEVAPAFYDLYSGMPGEILFFAYLGLKTGNERYSEIALKAFYNLHLRIEQSFRSIRSLGLFAGWGSLIYMLAHLGKTRNDKICLMVAEQWLERMDIDDLLDQEINSGMIKGSAGFILACLALYKQTLSDKLLQLTEKLADRLVQKSIRFQDQMYWKSISELPLTGFAHGSSGFALSFARMYENTGKTCYKEYVHRILNYENSLFNPEENNWPDLRDFIRENSPDQTVYSTAWSHGSPGIGLVRLELLKLGFQEQYLKTDLKNAIRSCTENGFGGKHSLCFGDFGNLELLITASEHFRDDALKQFYVRRASMLLNDGLRNGFKLTNTKIQSLGLMSGLTGIAYQCLHISDPENIPSLLSISE